jgi:serine/threonine protein kinase
VERERSSAPDAVHDAIDDTAPYAISSGSISGIGATIGRYKIRRILGSGGMGLVVAAHDPQLGRLVAIKLVTRNSKEARARLVREAQAMARLSHPNVVTAHRVMRFGDRAGIVMDLVEGETLAAWRAAQPRAWQEVVAAYVQAARGLAAAHRAGLVHRDFKPSNAIMDPHGVVRVVDFGLARATGALSPDESASEAATAAADRLAVDLTLTRSGEVIGTPAYMAPEQHSGGPIDARTDQWALACSLYVALYGQRPFPGRTFRELTAGVLSGSIHPEPPGIPVPRPIRAAIRRALALEPADRFPTMDDLIAALSRRGVCPDAASRGAAAGAA